jgi:hypothetical protein
VALLKFLKLKVYEELQLEPAQPLKTWELWIKKEFTLSLVSALYSFSNGLKLVPESVLSDLLQELKKMIIAKTIDLSSRCFIS